MTGIILAGGESRRMGADKAFLTLAGRPLIEHVLDVFQGLFEKTLIVTNSPQDYAAYGVPLVSDALAVHGPLTGIYSGMLHTADEYYFVAACDMPYLNAELISFMARSATGYDAVVPNAGGLIEPLHAVYGKSLFPVIEQHLRQKSRRIRDIFMNASVRYITAEEIERFDPQQRSFINLNTPVEYKEAVCSDLECRS